MLLLVFFVGLALALRLPGMGSRDLWGDELVQYVISSAPSNRELLDRLVQWDRNPPLFSLLVHEALRLGSSETVMRLPSLVGGIGAVIVAWYLGRWWFGIRGGSILALLCAVCPSYIFFSREARPYALGLLAIYGFLLSLSAFRRRPDTSQALLLGFVSVAAITLQYANTVVVAVGLGALVWDLLRSEPRKWSLMANCGWVVGAAGVMAAMTVLVFMRHQVKIHGTGSSDFLKIYFFHLNSLSSIVAFFPHGMAGFLKYTTFAEFMPSPWGALCLLGWLPLLPAAIWAFRRRGPPRFLAVVSLGTLAAFVFMAGIGAHPFGAVRHALPLTPGIFLLFTYAIVTLLERGGARALIAWGFLLLVIIQMAAADYIAVPHWHKYGFRNRMGEVEGKGTSDETVVVAGIYASIALRHYVGQGDDPARWVYVSNSPVPKPAESAPLRDSVETSLRQASGVWIVEVFDPQSPWVDLRELGAVCVEERTSFQVRASHWTLLEKKLVARPGPESR